MTAALPVPNPAIKHSLADDVLGFACGTIVLSLGFFLLRAAGLVSGGTAGVALLLSYATPIPFGALFFVVNVPFFILAIRSKGWGFVLRSCLAIGLVSASTSLHTMPGLLGQMTLDPFYAALIGAPLVGLGVLFFFRHGASMGGFNILGLVLQERYNLRAGYVMMALDATVVLAAFAIADWTIVLASAIGAVLMNLVIALNHRPGRYAPLATR